MGQRTRWVVLALVFVAGWAASRVQQGAGAQECPDKLMERNAQGVCVNPFDKYVAQADTPIVDPFQQPQAAYTPSDPQMQALAEQTQLLQQMQRDQREAAIQQQRQATEAAYQAQRAAAELESRRRTQAILNGRY